MTLPSFLSRPHHFPPGVICRRIAHHPIQRYFVGLFMQFPEFAGEPARLDYLAGNRVTAAIEWPRGLTRPGFLDNRQPRKQSSRPSTQEATPRSPVNPSTLQVKYTCSAISLQGLRPITCSDNLDPPLRNCAIATAVRSDRSK